MTVEELERQNDQVVVEHAAPRRLERAAMEFYEDTAYIDPPADFMERTQAEAEREGAPINEVMNDLIRRAAGR
jgi:hypothetical protein